MINQCREIFQENTANLKKYIKILTSTEKIILTKSKKITVSSDWSRLKQFLNEKKKCPVSSVFNSTDI